MQTHTSEPHLFWECCWGRTDSLSPVTLPPCSYLPFRHSLRRQHVLYDCRASTGISFLVASCCRPSSIHLWRKIVLRAELCDSLPVSRQMYSRDCGRGKGGGGGEIRAWCQRQRGAEPGYITVWDHSPALIVWIKPSMNHSFSLALAFTCQPHDHLNFTVLELHSGAL